MADKQISDLTAASTPLDGTEVVHVKQGSNSRKALASSFGAMILLASAEASNSSSIDFTTGFSSTFDEYEIHFHSVVPVTDNTDVHLQVSTDGGSSWVSGAGTYKHAKGVNSSGSSAFAGLVSTGDTKIIIQTALGNATGENARCVIRCGSLNSALYKLFDWQGSGYDSTERSLNWMGGSGVYLGTSAVNGIRLILSSGNISSGKFYLYGIRKS